MQTKISHKDIVTAAEAMVFPMADWLGKRLVARWYPRSIPLAVRHVAARLQDRPCLFYGAGSHTMELLAALREKNGQVDVRAILDRNPGEGKKLAGVSVVPLTEALTSTLPIVLSHHEFEDAMFDTLLALGIDPKRIIGIYCDPGYGASAVNSVLPGLLAQTNEIAPAGKKKRIVFLNIRKRRIVDRTIVAAVKKMLGAQCIRISLERQPRVSPVGGFDAELDCGNSLMLGLKLLASLNPDLVYVQEHYSSGNFLPMALALAMPETPVVGEFYDFIGLTFDDPMVLAEESYWRPEDVQLAMAAEKWCVANLAGIVTKESGPGLHTYLQGGRYFELRPYLSSKEYLPCQAHSHAQPARLIWAGAINASHLSPRMYGDNQLIDVFELLASLGFIVCAQTSIQEEKTLRDLYSDYLALADRRENFAIRTAIPREALLTFLRDNFDFGLMVGIPKPDTMQNISHGVTVSGKMFTYLAAGLPVIVGGYLTVMADWVRKFGLGIVVDHRRIHTLPDTIAGCDYGKLLDNVEAYRREHCLENMLPALGAFLLDTAATGKKVRA